MLRTAMSNVKLTLDEVHALAYAAFLANGADALNAKVQSRSHCVLISKHRPLLITYKQQSAMVVLLMVFFASQAT